MSRYCLYILVGFYIYIEYLLCINGQHDNPDDTKDVNSEDNPDTTNESRNGDTAVMGFLVITICCLFGCCINICLRSSRRQRRIRGFYNHNNAIQLFTINNESNDEYEETECEEDILYNNKEINDTGTLINLDEYKSNDNINGIDINAIKKEKRICVICHDLLSGNIRILDCNHIFCQNCIVQWEKEGKCECPICRQKTCSTKYINKNKKNKRQINSHSNRQRVVIITQNRNNGSHNVRVLNRNNSDLQLTMPVHAFLL
eukprot:303233_1